MTTAFTPTQCQRIDDLLLELLTRSEADAVFLCNRGGYILAEVMTQTYENTDNIAALAAGSFYATREIARLVGEPEFRCVFHQGDQKGIYMQNTGTDMLLVVVFGSQSNPGLARLFTEEMVIHLDRAVAEDTENEVAGALRSMQVDGNAPGMFAPPSS